MKMNFRNKYSFILHYFIFSTIAICLSEAASTGVLRVRIRRFTNPRNKLVDGSCCSPFDTSPLCKEQCNTLFRVCANTYISSIPFYLRKRTQGFPFKLSTLFANVVREYRRLGFQSAHPSQYPSIESNAVTFVPHSTTKSPKHEGKISQDKTEELTESCNLGELTTEVVAKSSLKGDEGVLEVQLPFNSNWPITFRLSIEAWNNFHGKNKSNGFASQLISRHVRHHSIKANQEWVPFKYNLEKEKTIQYSLMVSCKRNYFGNNCNLRCDDLDGVRNDRINCTSSGEVSCFEGWTGDLCNNAICREGCHPDHGYCTQPGECKCALGWRGKNCDECVPLPGCKHGFCSSTSYECICEPGWEGNYCSLPVCRDGCHSTRGYCKFPNECRCRIGWGGETCEECKLLPGCANGYCIKPLECRCKEGWTGLHCDKPICQENCSSQHGYCLAPGECRCEVGWWKTNCDTCFPYPGCKFGTCEAPWECNCEEGWTGILCDQRNATNESFCNTNRGICLNGGTCVNVAGRNYTCACPSLFTGEHCDYLAYSRASIFPIFSRGSSGSRTTLSSTSIPSPTMPAFNISRALETTTATPEVLIKNSTDLSKSTPISPIFSFNITSSKENKTDLNENLSKQAKDFTSTTLVDENVSFELKFPETLTSSELADELFIPDNRRKKHSDIQRKAPSKQSSSFKERLFSDMFPIRKSGFYLDGIFNESVIPPKTLNDKNSTDILEFRDTDIVDDNPIEDSITNSDPNSPRANQIILKNSRHDTRFDPSLTEINEQESFFPPKEIRLVSQENPPIPSNLRVSPFIFNVFDSLPQASAHSDKPFTDFSHLAPQTRINRRTGTPPSRLVLSRDPSLSKLPQLKPQRLISDSDPDKKEHQEPSTSSTTISYYEEHYDGRVHIGDVTEVDKHAPLEAIVDAFIELKKLTS